MVVTVGETATAEHAAAAASSDQRPPATVATAIVIERAEDQRGRLARLEQVELRAERGRRDRHSELGGGERRRPRSG